MYIHDVYYIYGYFRASKRISASQEIALVPRTTTICTRFLTLVDDDPRINVRHCEELFKKGESGRAGCDGMRADLLYEYMCCCGAFAAEFQSGILCMFVVFLFGTNFGLNVVNHSPFFGVLVSQHAALYVGPTDIFDLPFSMRAAKVIARRVRMFTVIWFDARNLAISWRSRFNFFFNKRNVLVLIMLVILRTRSKFPKINGVSSAAI